MWLRILTYSGDIESLGLCTELSVATIVLYMIPPLRWSSAFLLLSKNYAVNISFPKMCHRQKYLRQALYFTLYTDLVRCCDHNTTLKVSPKATRVSHELRRCLVYYQR